MSYNDCYSYFKTFSFNHNEQWVMGSYDTCSLSTTLGRVVSVLLSNAATQTDRRLNLPVVPFNYVTCSTYTHSFLTSLLLRNSGDWRLLWASSSQDWGREEEDCGERRRNTQGGSGEGGRRRYRRRRERGVSHRGTGHQQTVRKDQPLQLKPQDCQRIWNLHQRISFHGENLYINSRESKINRGDSSSSVRPHRRICMYVCICSTYVRLWYAELGTTSVPWHTCVPTYLPIGSLLSCIKLDDSARHSRQQLSATATATATRVLVYFVFLYYILRVLNSGCDDEQRPSVLRRIPHRQEPHPHGGPLRVPVSTRTSSSGTKCFVRIMYARSRY